MNIYPIINLAFLSNISEVMILRRTPHARYHDSNMSHCRIAGNNIERWYWNGVLQT